jgi:hypothetical protein
MRKRLRRNINTVDKKKSKKTKRKRKTFWKRKKKRSWNKLNQFFINI